MHQWSTRYFILSGSKISYKLKADSPNFRGTFDLMPGCCVTEVQEEKVLKIKGRKLYSFWLVWPHDKNGKPLGDKTVVVAADDSDDEGDTQSDAGLLAASATTLPQLALQPPLPSHPPPQPVLHRAPSGVLPNRKRLQDIVDGEVETQKRQRELVEQQVERHQAYDQNVGIGAKIAAVAVGGVVVGAFTAGIGLIPYLTVVGITAVASGGAVAMQYRRRPEDSRLIMAFDSMSDAVSWQRAIQARIALVNTLRANLPDVIDPKIISEILNMGTVSGEWKCVAVREGLRIMEHVTVDNSSPYSVSTLRDPSKSILPEYYGRVHDPDDISVVTKFDTFPTMDIKLLETSPWFLALFRGSPGALFWPIGKSSKATTLTAADTGGGNQTGSTSTSAAVGGGKAKAGDSNSIGGGGSSLTGSLYPSLNNSRCRKANMVLQCVPVEAFLKIMDIQRTCWPKDGCITVCCFSFCTTAPTTTSFQ